MEVPRHKLAVLPEAPRHGLLLLGVPETPRHRLPLLSGSLWMLRRILGLHRLLDGHQDMRGNWPPHQLCCLQALHSAHAHALALRPRANARLCVRARCPFPHSRARSTLARAHARALRVSRAAMALQVRALRTARCTKSAPSSHRSCVARACPGLLLLLLLRLVLLLLWMAPKESPLELLGANRLQQSHAFSGSHPRTPAAAVADFVAVVESVAVAGGRGRREQRNALHQCWCSCHEA